MTESGKRETVARTGEGTHVHKKLLANGGEFGMVTVRLEPLAPGSGFQFVCDLKDAYLPAHLAKGAEAGIREGAATGVLAGGPVVDVKATLMDGRYHEMDSNFETFRIAAREAFREAMWNAGPKLVEPK
jgi:elongation factor G